VYQISPHFGALYNPELLHKGISTLLENGGRIASKNMLPGSFRLQVVAETRYASKIEVLWIGDSFRICLSVIRVNAI